MAEALFGELFDELGCLILTGGDVGVGVLVVDVRVGLCRCCLR